MPKEMDSRDIFHITSDKKGPLLFHRESFSLARVSDEIAETLNSLKNDENNSEIFEQVRSAFEKNHDLVRQHPEPGVVLYLNISNACNLGCIYCYAGGGSYQSPAGYMNLDGAKEAIEDFYKNSGLINTICYFGGEPLLNAKIIPQLCEHARSIAEKLEVVEPTFSMVTNATLVTEEIAEMLRRYDFSLTVSLDGPQDIHDHLRPFKDASASFEMVDTALRLLKKKELPLQIECTFTPAHLKMGYTPRGLFDFFSKEYGVTELAVAPVAMQEQFPEYTAENFYREITPLYCELARASLESVLTESPLMFQQVKYILRYFLGRLRRDDNQFCYTKLGEKLFANTKSGETYPCQMLADIEDFNLGKSHDSLQDPGKNSHLKHLDKSENQCSSCWARHLCFMCPAGVFLETGSMAKIPEHRCDFIKSIIEETLSFCGSVQEDQKSVDKLVEVIFG